MQNTEKEPHNVLVGQNEVIIALLARQIIGITQIFDVVTRSKKDPAAYVRAYNSLDGSLGVTDAGKIAGVSQPTMTGVLKTWERAGIVYNTGQQGRPLYRRLLVLPLGDEYSVSGKEIA